MTVIKRKFKAEVNNVLDLVIHSLYSHKEIFLRELISNASDAIDKARDLALSDSAINPAGDEWQIELILDETAGTLTVRDNGIGLTRDEAAEALGTIAHSGTKEFLQLLESREVKDNRELDYLADADSEPTQVLKRRQYDLLQTEGVREALEQLDPRSRRIIEARWLVEKEPATLQKLAAEYGVSAERIRQIEGKALKSMRAQMNAA